MVSSWCPSNFWWRWLQPLTAQIVAFEKAPDSEAKYIMTQYITFSLLSQCVSPVWLSKLQLLWSSLLRFVCLWGHLITIIRMESTAASCRQTPLVLLANSRPSRPSEKLKCQMGTRRESRANLMEMFRKESGKVLKKCYVWGIYNT